MNGSSGPRRQRRPEDVDVVVLGLGNVLMGDDAFGPHVVRRIQASYTFDPGVCIIDAGTPGFDIASLIEDAKALIVVDTVAASGPPGELRLYRRPQLLERIPGPRTATHEPYLRETLLTLELHDRGPSDVLLIGMIPAVIAPRTCLSPAASAALWPAELEVLRDLIRLGQRPRLSWPPGRPDIWWERHPASHHLGTTENNGSRSRISS